MRGAAFAAAARHSAAQRAALSKRRASTCGLCCVLELVSYREVLVARVGTGVGTVTAWRGLSLHWHCHGVGAGTSSLPPHVRLLCIRRSCIRFVYSYSTVNSTRMCAQSLESLDNGKPYAVAYAADLPLTIKCFRCATCSFLVHVHSLRYGYGLCQCTSLGTLRPK